MWHLVSALGVGAWVLAACAVASPADKSDNGTEPEPEEIVQTEPTETVQGEPIVAVQTEPIGSGLVFVDGRFVPPPYVAERRGDDLVLNDRVVARNWFAPPSSGAGKRAGTGPQEGQRVSRPGKRPAMGPPEAPGAQAPDGRPGTGPGKRREGHVARGGHRREEARAKTLQQIEDGLGAGGMLFCLDGKTARLVDGGSATSVLDVLLSDHDDKEKLRRLSDEGVRGARSAQWARIVETFEPTPELMSRVGYLIEEIELVAAENEARHGQLMLAAYFRSKPMRYGVTIVAMMLAVVALGSLLSYRPEARVRWRDIDASGDGAPMVVRNVVLLVLLGSFDLMLTLAAQQSGGFLELNPLGSQLMGSPWLLIAFKMATLLGASAILVSLRRYRGAQIASWWLCLVCTVLAFRWLTYNSMFFA